MRQVQQIMGMPISIDIPNCEDKTIFNEALERLRQIDKRFSPYKPDSEVSKYKNGELKEEELSKELKSVIKACREAERWTDGYFSAWAAGTFDPSGYVKGWAVSQAGKIIGGHGYQTYCIGAGGDILARSNSDKIWNIGIQDPTVKDKILNMLSISNGAVATSGSYERGAHIINPKTKQPADELLSVTVTGPYIIKADILATAIFAAGNSNQKFIYKQPDYKVHVIKK
jgi:thiamine biosynthesis lipoprotein